MKGNGGEFLLGKIGIVFEPNFKDEKEKEGIAGQIVSLSTAKAKSWEEKRKKLCRLSVLEHNRTV